MIQISFRRDPLYTDGGGNEAWCYTPDKRRHEIPTLRKRDGTFQTGNNGAVVYRLIKKLCDAGWSGEEFIANDGRIDCLQGIVSLKAIPVKYGGVKKGD